MKRHLVDAVIGLLLVGSASTATALGVMLAHERAEHRTDAADAALAREAKAKAAAGDGIGALRVVIPDEVQLARAFTQWATTADGSVSHFDPNAY